MKQLTEERVTQRRARMHVQVQQWLEANPEAIPKKPTEEERKAQRREYYLANRERARKRYIENRERLLELGRAYRAANREVLREKDRAKRRTLSAAQREKQRAWREANREVLLEKQRAYDKKRKEKQRAYYAEWRKANPEKYHKRARTQQLRRNYNLTWEDYNALLKAQNNACAICKRAFDKTPHVDHDHACCPGHRSCGSCVRGLLCDLCNRGLSLYRDDIDLLLAARDYLIKHRGFLA